MIDEWAEFAHFLLPPMATGWFAVWCSEKMHSKRFDIECILKMYQVTSTKDGAIILRMSMFFSLLFQNMNMKQTKRLVTKTHQIHEKKKLT